jgi:hypothetical protein
VPPDPSSRSSPWNSLDCVRGFKLRLGVLRMSWRRVGRLEAAELEEGWGWCAQSVARAFLSLSGGFLVPVSLTKISSFSSRGEIFLPTCRLEPK